jgi:mono/diheme cytochrome c family protein
MWLRSCVLISTGLVTLACRQDMHDQPRYKPYALTTFFGDDRSARPPVEGTIARGQLHLNQVLFTGFSGDAPARNFPFAITADDLLRGQERFNIFCSPCHSELGDGNGIVVRRGFRQARNFHTEQMRNAPSGHFFDVITNGFGAMPSYAYRIEPEDRWRIIAYIRALQLSQNATPEDVPADARAALEVAQ